MEESTGTTTQINTPTAPHVPTGPPPSHPFATLPPGWTTAADPQDGRLFYWHAATGSSSWTHPNASTANNIKNKKDIASTRQTPQPPPGTAFAYQDMATTTTENPYWASRRPDNHQCEALACLLLCTPLGILALYHSVRVDQCWKAGEYSDAVVASRRSRQFSSWGIFLGAIFWILWFFFRRGRGEWEWPEWRLND